MLSSRSLSVIKLQYFIAYAVMGSLAPFLSLFLKQVQGLQEAQVGYAMGASNVAVVLMPVLVTSLADMRQDSRRLLAIIFGISGLALTGLFFVRGFWPTVILLCLHSLSYVAMTPLQDGLNFAVQQQRTAAGQSSIPFHQIRVWGTVGFIVPSLLLFAFLADGAHLNAILIAASTFCLLGLLNSFRLPDSRAQLPGLTIEAPATEIPNPEAPDTEVATPAKQQLPVVAAWRVLRRPPVMVFCLSLMLTHLTSATYYAFYPLYLTETIGIPQQWVGLIFNFGVLFEIGFMLAFGWLLERLGFRKFMALGILCLVLRLSALALFPSPVVAIGSQVVHGMIVVALQVAPALYLNRQAGDAYRTTMQGMLTMLTGASRVAGSVLAGRVAENSLQQAFGFSAALSLVAALFFLVAFRDDFAGESSSE
ncbi:MAG: transporter, family, 3-phenylpropionic acid transporter [Abditibacteriota bacterium]|nr:transporter, family, 3-phenylpropionic acid transporter [Abditibacteriota bacterium]